MSAIATASPGERTVASMHVTTVMHGFQYTEHVRARENKTSDRIRAPRAVSSLARARTTWRHDVPESRFQRMDRLGLAWVLVDGRPRSVSDFAALRPRQRPRPSCPLAAAA